MSAVETRTFRAETLDSVLGLVREELGPDALVLRQRDGILGGIGGFFGKRCVEVDVEVPQTAPNPARTAAVPPRALADAYGARPEVVFDDGFVSDDPDGGTDIFRNLLDGSSVFASTLAQAIEDDPKGTIEAPGPAFEPEPVLGTALAPQPEPEEWTVASSSVELPVPTAEPELSLLAPSARVETLPAAPKPGMSLEAARYALGSAGFDARLVQSIVEEADTQLRIFASDEPFEDQVRRVLVARLATRRPGGWSRHPVIAVVGAPGSGKTSAVARLCEAYVSSGKRVGALSLEPVRKVVELARTTDDLAVELIAADQPELIEFALERLAKVDVIIVDTPGVEPNDEEGWSSLAELLEPLKPVKPKTHLLVPGTLTAPGIDALVGTARARLRINRLLLTHLDGPADVGPGISASLRSGIPISATATSTSLRPADPHELVRAILP